MATPRENHLARRHGSALRILFRADHVPALLLHQGGTAEVLVPPAGGAPTDPVRNGHGSAGLYAGGTLPAENHGWVCGRRGVPDERSKEGAQGGPGHLRRGRGRGVTGHQGPEPCRRGSRGEADEAAAGKRRRGKGESLGSWAEGGCEGFSGVAREPDGRGG